jgi:hypothetical protein
MAPRIIYEVSAIINDEETARRWTRWIVDEHIADVIAAGAQAGRLIQLDDTPRTYVVQYEFASRGSLEQYLREHAPRLREEGARRFGATEVVYTRRTGSVIA